MPHRRTWQKTKPNCESSPFVFKNGVNVAFKLTLIPVLSLSPYPVPKANLNLILNPGPRYHSNQILRKRQCKNLYPKVLIPFIGLGALIAVAVAIVTLLQNQTSPQPHSGVSGAWSSWSPCHMCLRTQSRNCTTPPCKGRTERECSPPTMCADDYGNNCCDRNHRCSVSTSTSVNGPVSQCCLSNTTFDPLVWPSNQSGLDINGTCCLGLLNSFTTDLVSAVGSDGFCCLGKQNVSGVTKSGTCCIDAMNFSAVTAIDNGGDIGNGECCLGLKGMSAVARTTNGCNRRGMCCGSVALTIDGECCMGIDGEEAHN